MTQKSSKRAKSEAEAPPLATRILQEGLKFQFVGEMEKAIALYRAVLALQISAEANYYLGMIYHGQGRLEEAVAAYRDAIFAKIDYADAYANLATVMKDLGKQNESLIFYRQALAYAPLTAQTHSNLGVLYNEMKLPAEALTQFRRAVVISPEYEWSYLNMASALLESCMAEQSVQVCQRALTLRQDLPIAQFNRGASLKALNRLDEAVACFREAIRVQPEFAEAHFGLAQTLLMRGDYEEGWREYDWRWALAEYNWLRNIHGEFSQPRWRGETIAGKTILIYAEQGMGDAIQHVRYIPRVLALGAKVVLSVHPPLIPLFASLQDVAVVGLDQVPLPAFDWHCPLLGLPEIFAIRLDTVPADVPYLAADPDKVKHWKRRIAGKGLKVGIIWAGNPTQRGDRWRSPRLAAMAPLFDVPGVTFVALQKGAGREDLAQNPLPPSVVDLGDDIADFADTAAIMEGLDLVITSCTAPLHLAGALGVPTWAVIPFSPHFLWLLGRSDSPWYPSLTLYRQDCPGSDWTAPVERMASDLAALTMQRKAKAG
jgi:tetratricopeptide (TPR) repeat protein